MEIITKKLDELIPADYTAQHHVAVVGHAVRHHVLPLEEVDIMVVHADILDVA